MEEKVCLEQRAQSREGIPAASLRGTLCHQPREGPEKGLCQDSWHHLMPVKGSTG